MAANQPTILVVEDESSIASFVSLYLRNAGIRFYDLDTNQSSLEDIFVSLVRAP